MPEFGIALGLLCVMALLLNHSTMQRTAFIMLGNWVVCQIFVELSGNYTPWSWFWAMDLIAAAAVLVHPLGRHQQVIGGIYGVMIGWHTAFAWSGNDAGFYLYGLDFALLMQMVVLFLWGVGHGVAHISGLHRLNPFHNRTH